MRNPHLQENGIDALSAFYADAPDSDLKGALADINAVFRAHACAIF